MPDKVYLDDNGEPIGAPKVYLDDSGEPVGAKPAGPMNMLKGAKDELSGQWEGIKTLGQTAFDIAKHSTPAGIADDPAWALAAGKGFREGATDAAKHLWNNPKEAAMAADPTGVSGSLRGKEDNWTKAGHAGALVAEMLLPSAIKKVGALARVGKAVGPIAETAVTATRTPELGAAAFKSPVSGFSMPEMAPKPKPVGNLVKAKAPTAVDGILEGLADSRKPVPPLSVELPPPLKQPAVSHPKAPRAEPRPAALEPRLEAPVASNAAPAQEVGTKEAAALPESWQQFAEPKSGGIMPEVGIPEDIVGMGGEDVPFWSEPAGPPDVSGLRGALGADKAGAVAGVEPDLIRNTSGQPSRRPLAADAADLDNGYMRQLANERGGIDPTVLRTMGGAAAGGAGLAAAADDDHKVGAGVVGALTGAAAMNPMKTLGGLQKLRVMGMLSGAALPKSMAGNFGAIGTAAIEKQSMRPIQEALRVPTNIRTAVSAFKNNANPSHIEGIARFNLPARTMGALDATTTSVLERAGLTLPEAQRLLLTDPNTMGHGGLGRAMKSTAGRAAFPFQNTPMNTVAEGLDSVNGLIGGTVRGKPKHTPIQRGLTAASMAAGAGAGEMTDDPRTLALLAAFAGPRALPMALGMGATAGPRVLEKVGVGLPEGGFADLYNPVRPILSPSIINFIKYLTGEDEKP